jgi:hypothetical protein
MDERLQMAAWGTLALAFPRASDLHDFGSLLCRVAVRAGSLAAHPAAALLHPTVTPPPPAAAPAATPPGLSQLSLPSNGTTAAGATLAAGSQLATPGKVEERVSSALARTPVPFSLGPAPASVDVRRL